MRKTKVLAIIALALGIAAFHSCKKDDELTKDNGTRTETSAFNPNGINDMNAYLGDFIKNMKSPSKDINAIPTDEAEWHLSACLNYQLCNANANKTDMIYDTIITSICINDNGIAMSEINNSFDEISRNVISLFNSYELEDKQLVFIHSTIDDDNNAKGNASVRTIMATGSSNPHFYFDTWEYICLDTLLPCDNEYYWKDAADTLEHYVNYFGTQYMNDDYYYVSTSHRTFNFRDYYLNPPITQNHLTFYNRLFVYGNAPASATTLNGFEMVFYLDSYLGLACTKPQFGTIGNAASLISARIDVPAEKNRDTPGELIYHDLVGFYGVAYAHGDNER